jgi:predicted P-loop ATPase
MSEGEGVNNELRKALNDARNQVKSEKINEVKQINDQNHEPIFIEDSVRAEFSRNQAYHDIIQAIKERVYLGKKPNTDFTKQLKELANDSDFYEVNKYIPTLIKETYEKYKALFAVKGKSTLPLVRVEKYIAHFFPDLVFNEVLDKQQNTKIGYGEDISTQTIWRRLMHEGVKTSVSEVNDIIKSDFLPRYHPFKEFFNALKWDGQDHIKKLCSYISTDDEEFFHQMLKKHLMRAVKCAIDDYYVNRFVFTLVSPIQELGKSTLIRFLNPFEKGMYYSEEPINAADKDAKIRLTQNFIYNLEELSSPSIKDIKAMKAIISQFNVTQRRAFRSDDKTMARRCTFFGSTNESEFLIDDVNTRWLCFNIYDRIMSLVQMKRTVEILVINQSLVILIIQRLVS